MASHFQVSGVSVPTPIICAESRLLRLLSSILDDLGQRLRRHRELVHRAACVGQLRSRWGHLELVHSHHHADLAGIQLRTDLLQRGFIQVDGLLEKGAHNATKSAATHDCCDQANRPKRSSEHAQHGADCHAAPGLARRPGLDLVTFLVDQTDGSELEFFVGVVPVFQGIDGQFGSLLAGEEGNDDVFVLVLGHVAISLDTDSPRLRKSSPQESS